MKKFMQYVLSVLVIVFLFLKPSLSLAVDADYTVNPGDVLQITVWKEDGLDKEVLVLPDGTITFPLVGTFVAKGMTVAEIQDKITDTLRERQIMPNASVTVMVKAALGDTVSVTGQVAKPGEIVMGHRFTVMQAISQAGGLTPYASESKIIILRHDANGKETSIPFDYSDVSEGKNLDKDVVLKAGDVIVVPTAGLF